MSDKLKVNATTGWLKHCGVSMVKKVGYSKCVVCGKIITEVGSICDYKFGNPRRG